MANDYSHESRVIERRLRELDALDDTQDRFSSSTLPQLRFEPKDQIRVYALESAHTALNHSEPLIALRAMCQLYSYAGRGGLSGTEMDWLIAARNRIEALVSSHRTFAA